MDVLKMTGILLPVTFSIGVAVAVVAADHASSGGPSLSQVLTRTAAYSVAYGDALSSVVADEEFLQQLVSRDGRVMRMRRLESEIAFVKLAESTEWLAFRSVLRVDGMPIGDGAGRLERLFRDAPRSALAQARAITAESARHNLGPVERNFNVPTTVLQFVLRQHQDRFRFRKVGEDRFDGEGLWIVEFRERARSTFIRTPQGRDAPASGRLWIAPAEGRVVRSQLLVQADVRAEIETEWRYDDRLALWVPAEMREAYRGRWTSGAEDAAREEKFDVLGVAKYSNYRRFDVDVRIVR